MAIFGYVRRKRPLSTNDQLKIVADYHCKDIFIEKTAYHNLSEFELMMDQLTGGDSVVIASLQVLASTPIEIAKILAILWEKQVNVISWSAQLPLHYYRRTAGFL